MQGPSEEYFFIFLKGCLKRKKRMRDGDAMWPNLALFTEKVCRLLT